MTTETLKILCYEEEEQHRFYLLDSFYLSYELHQSAAKYKHVLGSFIARCLNDYKSSVIILDT